MNYFNVFVKKNNILQNVCVMSFRDSQFHKQYIILCIYLFTFLYYFGARLRYVFKKMYP